MLAAAMENPDPLTQLPDLGQFSDPDPLTEVEARAPQAETLKATMHVFIEPIPSLLPQMILRSWSKGTTQTLPAVLRYRV